MLGNCRDEVAIVEIDTWNGMKADVSRKIVMDVGCFLIVRLKDGILTCIFPKILSIKKQV